MRVFFDKFKVFLKCGFYTVANGVLNSPVPLGVKVSVGNHIKFLFFFHYY